MAPCYCTGPDRDVMLFNSALYGIFLVAAYAVFWLLASARAGRLRAAFLVGASYAFYFYGTFDAAQDQDVPLGPAGWSALCLGIIFVGSTLDFGIGLALARVLRPAARRALLLCSIVYYLGVLAVFKYWNFGVDSAASGLHALGVAVRPTHLRLVLPFGISFFTFETMSYTIDVYRREIEPSRRYLDYLLFVCFFPHLVAGPIVRPQQMLPQLARRPAYDAGAQARGLFRIAVGLAKKIAIGDVLAAGIVGRVFDNPERYSSLEVLVAVYAYAIQIYADFSGYTDVALGSAALFGYELPENFDRPYLARDLQDFWRRWHISLSTWLRDYLYIPLGGSRGSSWQTYRNLMITMLLGGLWHGASWNFVIWGALHGGALAVTRMWQRRRARSDRAAKVPGVDSGAIGAPPVRGAAPRGARPAPSAAWSAVATIATFHYVCFAWIFFRAPTFGHAALVLERIARGTWETTNLSSRVVVVLAAGFAAHAAPRRFVDAVRERFVVTPSWVQGLVLAAAAYGIHLAAGAKAEPFVYGQF